MAGGTGLFLAALGPHARGAWRLGLTSLGAFILASSLANAVKVFRARSIISRLLDRGTIEGLTVEPGVLYACYDEGGYQENSWSFSWLGFKPVAPPLQDPAEAWARVSRLGYFAARVAQSWLRAAAPALRVLDKCCRGALVAAAAPGWGLDAGPAVARLCWDTGCATAEAVLRGGRLWWSLSLGELPRRARAVRLELEATLQPAAAGHGSSDSGYISRQAILKLAKAKEPTVMHGERVLAPQAARAAVTVEAVDQADIVLGLYRALTGEDVILAPPLAGLRLKLVLDRPLARDLVERAELRPRA